MAAYENLKKQKNTQTHLKNDSKGFRFLVKLQARMPATLLKMKYSKLQFKLITLIFIIVMFKNSYSTIWLLCTCGQNHCKVREGVDC